MPTLTNRITLSVIIMMASIAGWHYYAHLEIEKATQAYVDEYLAKWESKATAKVDVNPLSNFASIYVVLPPRSDNEQIANMIVDAIIEQVRTIMEPRIDRELELAARKYLDLYAMALPYRVSIVVEEADEDPHRR